MQEIPKKTNCVKSMHRICECVNVNRDLGVNSAAMDRVALASIACSWAAKSPQSWAPCLLLDQEEVRCHLCKSLERHTGSLFKFHMKGLDWGPYVTVKAICIWTRKTNGAMKMKRWRAFHSVRGSVKTEEFPKKVFEIVRRLILVLNRHVCSMCLFGDLRVGCSGPISFRVHFFSVAWLGLADLV